MNKASNITLLFVGDIYTGQAKPNVSPDIQSIASRADLVVVNLESPLTEDGIPLSGKTVHLKSNTSGIEVLQKLSTNVACLANNHICDYGSEGLSHTRETLADNNIIGVGAGMNRAEAEKPAIIEYGNMKIGFSAFGSADTHTVPAGENTFGCATLEPQRMLKLISELQTSVDVIVLLLHWGYTNYHFPLPEHVRLGRSLIDAGATLVVGHHPHVIQGYEHYSRGVIIYSLGDFIFGKYYLDRKLKPERLSRENYKGMMCLVNLAGQKNIQSVEFKHTQQDSKLGTVQIVSPQLMAKRQRFLGRLSKPLARPDYARFFRWYTFCRIIYRAVRWLHPKQWRHINRRYLAGVRLALRRSILGRT